LVRRVVCASAEHASRWRTDKLLISARSGHHYDQLIILANLHSDVKHVQLIFGGCGCGLAVKKLPCVLGYSRPRL